MVIGVGRYGEREEEGESGRAAPIEPVNFKALK